MTYFLTAPVLGLAAAATLSCAAPVLAQNALIRGVNRLANEELPAAVIMCTNRLSALDPAVRRRAADVLIFERPNDLQRRAALTTLFQGLNDARPDRGPGRGDRRAARAGLWVHLF